MNVFCQIITIGSAVLSLTGMAQSQDLMGFDRASFGSVVLSQSQSAGPDLQFELAIGNYENEPIINYSVGSVFAQIGRSVGRLDVLTDKGMFPCTAFIVSKKYILTNYHCSLGLLDNEKIGATRIDVTQFVAGYTQTGIEEGTKKYTVIPTPVETSKRLDYAVLEVIGDPSQEYGQLNLSSNLPNGGDPFWIIGHPMGEGQRISREKCKANKPALSAGKLLHTCDTLPGNSGSPVIDAGLQQVVALHHAGSRNDSINYAIPMSEILENSKVLAAYKAPEVLPDVNPKPAKIVETTACDALYSAAAAAKACYAYDVYIKSCPTHILTPMASGYLIEFCGNSQEKITNNSTISDGANNNISPKIQLIKYADGSVYEGTLENGQKNGQGSYTMPTGYTYAGQWENDEISGQGTAKYPDGSIYEGTFSKGRPNGLGSIVYDDGSTYVGDWLDGKISGKGVAKYENGLRYEGDFKNTMHHGQGILTSDTGYSYDGSWVNGAKQGSVTQAQEIVAVDYLAAAVREALSETVTEILRVETIKGIQQQIAPCWNLGATSSASLFTTVVVGMQLTIEGKPLAKSIHLVGYKGGDQLSAERAFKTAQRAINKCGVQGFKLPKDEYTAWQHLELVFDPTDLKLR